MQKKYFKGSIHRALLIRAKINYMRLQSIFFKFGENTVVLVTKNIVPVSNRIFGPIIREMSMRWPSVGCVSSTLV